MQHIYPSTIHPCVHLIHPPTHLFIYSSIHPSSICPSSSMYLPVHLPHSHSSTCPSTYLSTHPSSYPCMSNPSIIRTYYVCWLFIHSPTLSSTYSFIYHPSIFPSLSPLASVSPSLSSDLSLPGGLTLSAAASQTRWPFLSE